MAKSTSRPPKKPTPISAATPFDEALPDTSAPESSESVPLEPETAQPTPFEPKPAATRTPTFYQTMNKIPKADWGPRANIYLYRVEPTIDRTRQGGDKYLDIYAQPVNEDRIMADYGSGRYKLILNYKKQGAEVGDLIDAIYIDILNMKYPPKIPLGEWVDDPKNKKWAWAKEANGIPTTPAPAPAASGLEAVVDVMRATSEMRRDIREEMQASTPATPPAPPPAPDPFDTAAKIMAMRANDPMTAVMMQLLTNANNATEAARTREFQLQQQLLEAKSAPAGPIKSLADQALELIPLFDKFEPLLKRLGIGTGAGAVEGVVRAARTTGMDILHDVVTNPQIVQTLYAAAVNLPLLFGRGTPPPQNGQATSAAVLPAIQQPAAPPQSTGETEQQRMERIGAQVTEPMLYQFFLKGQTGDVWAEQMSVLWPNEFKFTQELGAEKIVDGYRNTRAWMIVGPMEADFLQFMREFCAWKEGDEGQPDDIGITDLDQDEATS